MSVNFPTRISLAIASLVFAGITTVHAQSGSLPDSALVAHYSFSGNANDVSGNYQHATVDGATLTTDRFGNSNSAYYFDGDDHIYLWGDEFWYAEEDAQFPGATVCAWIKTTATTQNNSIVQVNGHILYVNQQSMDNGSFMAAFDGSSHDNSSNDHSSSSVNTGGWVFVVATNDDDSTRLYVNGKLENTYPEQLYRKRWGNLTIGNQANELWPYTGAIDDVMIYARAITPDEVKAIYEYEEGSSSIGRAQLEIADVSVFPNPSVSGDFTISFGSSAETLNGNTMINVYDMQGREVYTESLKLNSGTLQHHISLGSLEQGVYMMKITNADRSTSTRIIKNQ